MGGEFWREDRDAKLSYKKRNNITIIYNLLHEHSARHVVMTPGQYI